MLLWCLYCYKYFVLCCEFFGLIFENFVGFVVGFDKDGKYYRMMANFGFGFIEVGIVMLKGQDGNLQFCLFCFLVDEGFINWMGFNNDGVEVLVECIKRYGKFKGVIIGGNIGKNKVIFNEQVVDDYVKCFEVFFFYVDYFVVNVSLFNMFNLCDFQEKEFLLKLL